MPHLFRALLILLGCVALTAAALPTNRPTPGYVRVRFVTSDGPIVLALDARRAPRTTANFLAYVDDGRFDDTKFYRSAPRKADPKRGFIQGGIGTEARRTLPPVAHEPTNVTGIRHLDGTISMARGGPPGTAMGNFFITLGPVEYMDARGDNPGYAAFGHVVAGMDTVRRILAEPIGGGTGPMKGQMILKPVRIITARRLDGIARPTGGPRPWLIKVPQRKPNPDAR
ncbi:peptidylprolyl isomerase [Sphingobium aquiterrae]|uniref:peptidylprolyl isomerase n=1 Tax=Sphingobium aquiterrae TaxID=2038656 RepID=UPI003015B7E8